MAQFIKIQQLLQQLEISFDANNFHALFSHIVRNHESFDKDDWKSLIQFDKNWEALGFKKAKEIYSSMNKNKGRQSTKLYIKDFSNESEKKQAKPRPQYKHDEMGLFNESEKKQAKPCPQYKHDEMSLSNESEKKQAKTRPQYKHDEMGLFNESEKKQAKPRPQYKHDEMGLTIESEKKQAKPRPQYKHNEMSHSNSISQWKCHNCGFNPNRVWRVRCYKCNAFRSDLNLENFDPYKMPSMAISENDKYLLRTEIIRAKGDKAEEEVKRLGYKYLDWQNYWKKFPIEVVNCKKLDHKTQESLYSETRHKSLAWCDTCKYYYHFDWSGYD
ncbi:15371_t:CDS:2 [Dentiscutata heterogama]|uniref:15371_t:CDS:1 n=1 Tax=Dentiscutata heterogama TaxID=1316150 RepID=A0ACA9M936_9GLOM|nr:15371_t:CDS:2 [Dentiscutata heterogama]